jgi:acylphosphatase
MIRRTVSYSGRVQGVGFRATAQYIARAFNVTGYVRNMDDGRVELIVEGESQELQRFLDALASEMGRYIREVNIQESPATGEFHSFAVTH